MLVQYATHPEVTTRLDSVADFLRELDKLEEEITAPPPDERFASDPTQARPGDVLDHGFTVKKRLGKGSTALALLVERGGKEQVLKVALTPAQNDRLRAEGEVLRKLRHPYIVELFEVLDFGERAGLVMAKAGDETLADRLRAEGRIHLELLERFGEDLLGAVDFLEQQGIPHRDIKPENLGVLELGSQRMRHLMLFDFSLARAPAENILAGTRGYLDPFLSERKPPRWDTHAERFAAAVTLYQMAIGALPQWGDGQSEPSVLDCEATLDADAFEPAVREGMHVFFAKALRRSIRDRFDNAQEMLRDWRELFAAARRPEALTDHGETPIPVTAISLVRLMLRVHFHYTPTSASWLNQVEGFFGILGKQSLRLTDFPSTGALCAHLRAYLRAWNRNPTPFAWTKPARAFIRSHRRMIDRISTAVH